MGAEAPQWLFGSFVQAMQEVGATAPMADLDGEARDLVDRWTEPGRRVHNLRHLVDVLARVDELAPTTHDPDVLRVATWYHGAVLNTAAAALLVDTDPVVLARSCVSHTSDRLTALGVSEDVAARIGELIIILATHTAPRDDLDAQVLVDADLAALAATPQEYKKYRQMLREEYNVDDLTYLRARRLIVRRLLSRPSVFQSPRGQAWEARARENLEAELAKVDEAIARLDPADPAARPVDEEDDLEQTTEAPLATGPGEEGEPVGSTGTIIIKRRHLKKNVCSTAPDEPSTTTGRLPTLKTTDDDRSAATSDEDDASSLETAIDALDVPSRPSRG